MAIKIPRNAKTIGYPESDGQPLADNTRQFRWIVVIKENLEALFSNQPEVFVAGDLLWYPVEGEPVIRRAPDAMVVFGRPKGDRGSYLQWREGGIAPQVVFEILSPGNSQTEMYQKLEFYDTYGVEEYYLYDPESNELTGWLRQDGRLRTVDNRAGWVSPRLGIRFDLGDDELTIRRPDGQPFLTYTEIIRLREAAEQRAEQAEQRAEQAEQRALAEQAAREAAEQRAAALAARLRELGVEP